jgi:urocanate hydratase
MTDFQRHILQGIPATLPPKAVYDPSVSHAPKRKSILTKEEEKLAIRNALRYFPKDWHIELARIFGRIT